LERLSARFPIELRFVDPPPRVTASHAAPARFRFWMRTREALPPAPLIHACATAYASDLLLLSTAAARHGLVVDQPGLHLASLDHAVWFHGEIRADDWLLYEQHTDWAGGARTLCRGALFDPAGTLVASVIQEGLLRMRRP
jgi:acyl-CoA thioesterase-2